MSRRISSLPKREHYFTQLAGRGVAVRVLTNSLEATDVALVHSSYARRRVELLSGGVELFELRRFPNSNATGDRGTDENRGGGSSLHAKTFAVDAERVFVGSLNFDPRSATLNTELGLVIDSPDLASRIEAIFRSLAPQLAYRVESTKRDRCIGSSRTATLWCATPGNPIRRGPTRLGIWFFSILPIEWLL